MDQLFGVRLVCLEDGAGRGVRVLEFRSGSGLSFEVLIDRAFDLGACELGGRAIAWQSAVGVRGPWYAEPQGLGFLRTFGGGLLTTGGLDHTLFPTEDSAAQYGYPPKQSEAYGLHGRLSNLPARLLGYGARWEGETCILWASGEVVQASSLGEHLTLRRRIEVRVGSNEITLQDEVENLGFHTTPHMFLYHMNLGYPLIDEGSEIVLPASDITAVGKAPLEDWQRLSAPQAGMEERVYEYSPQGDQDEVTAGIVNRAAGLGIYQVFLRSQLPHPFVWRMLGEGEYVVALEPSTNRVAGRHDARERDELILLAPGEKRRYDLKIGVLDGHAAVQGFTDRLKKPKETP
ncbi:aldose 1-epimerase family protein [Deinococcus sp.]|uniref:aldose 1-epimerase family protein n=1 Tax=Deinococcus sp. TaxID=47478 RepID=UPI003CC691E8